MYGIFTCIYPKNGTHVGTYSIHGASGLDSDDLEMVVFDIYVGKKGGTIHTMNSTKNDGSRWKQAVAFLCSVAPQQLLL